MPQGIVEAFPENPVNRQIECLAETLAVEIERDTNIFTPFAPEADEIIDGLIEAEIEQDGRTQLAKHRTDVQLDLGDRACDDFEIRPYLLSAFGAASLQRRNVDTERKQQRPDFVMQITREIGTFLFLHIGKLLLQFYVLLLCIGKARYHVVEAMRKISISGAPLSSMRGL